MVGFSTFLSANREAEYIRIDVHKSGYLDEKFNLHITKHYDFICERIILISNIRVYTSFDEDIHKSMVERKYTKEHKEFSVEII